MEVPATTTIVSPLPEDRDLWIENDSTAQSPVATGTVRRDIWRYLTSTAATSVVNAVRNVITSRLLGPYMTGLTQGLLAVPQFGQYASLAVIAAMPVYIPHHVEKSSAPRVARIKSSVLSFTLAVSTTLSLAGVVYAVLWVPADVRVHFILASSLILFWDISKFFTYGFAADRRFLTLSWVEFVFAALTLVVSVASIYAWGAYGFWVGSIVPNFALLGYCAWDFTRHQTLMPSLPDGRELAAMLPTGVVLLLSSESVNLFAIPSKVFLAATLGATQLGYFVPALLILSKLSMLPRTIATVVTPHMSAVYRKAGNSTEICGVFVKTQQLTFVLSGLLIVAGLVIIGPAMRLLLPQFTNGVPAARVMLIAGLPFALVTNASNTLIAIGRRGESAWILGLALALEIVLLGGLLVVGVTIVRVAAVQLVVFTCHAVVVSRRAIVQLRVVGSVPQILGIG